jgi:hypothetical protein
MQLLDSCSPQAFSNLVYAAAVLGLKPQRQWLSAFFRYSLPALPSFSPQALSNTAWALAKMVGDGSCHAKTLSCLFGLAPLKPCPLVLVFEPATPSPRRPQGFHPESEWEREFYKRCVTQTKLLAPQALSNIVWAVATLELHPGPDFKAAMLSATSGTETLSGRFSPQVGLPSGRSPLRSVLSTCQSINHPLINDPSFNR